jgi:adhesin transport system outer membrane protein
VQAESRALQVRMRIVQHEKTMRLALSKLTRFTRQSPTLVNPIPDNWRAVLPANIDERLHPALEAQQREVQVTRADQTALERGRWPRLDIEAGAGNHSYARLVTNWSFFDRAADYNVQTAAKQISAAQQRAELLERDLAQRAATAEADMAQSQFQIKAAEAQIGSSTQVVELYELQFKVGRRSLIELVNAYAELSATELSRTVALNDYRTAVVSYLYARAALADWALAQAPQTQVASEARP